jgi:hypothetical protein
VGESTGQLRLPHKLRQLGDVGGDGPGLVAGQQLGCCPSSRFILEIDVSERLAVVVALEAGIVVLCSRQ